MGGFQRRNSPTGVEPGSPRVQFAEGDVTGASRPSTNNEQWICYYFEEHATTCEACHDPLRVARSGKQLCRKGHDLAIDVAEILLYSRRDGKVHSRISDGEAVTVELPHNYEQTFSLLKAINRALHRREKFPVKPRSMDSNYYVEPRISSDRAKRDIDSEPQPQPLSMRRVIIREPKSPKPEKKPRRRERESSDDLIADSKRGSLYDEDMRRLETAEKREQGVKYNLEVREPNFKTPRRPLKVYP